MRLERKKLFSFWSLALIFVLGSSLGLANDETKTPSCDAALNGQPAAPPPRKPIEITQDGFVDEWLEDFQTSRLSYSGGRINKDIKARVLIIHGLGAMSSSAFGVKSFLRFFSNNDEQIKGGSVTKKIRNLPGFTLVGAESLNLPGAWPNKLPLEQFPTVDSVSDYVVRYLKVMKAETPDLPLIVMTKSAGGMYVENIVRRYPGLIDSMVLTSPTCPNTRTYRGAIDVLKREEAAGLITINWPVINWAMKLLDESSFVEETFSKVPTLILTGGRDEEVSREEREFYRHLDEQFKTVNYIDIPIAGHDMSREDTDMKKLGHPRTYFENDVVNSIGLIEEHFKKTVEKSF